MSEKWPWSASTLPAPCRSTLAIRSASWASSLRSSGITRFNSIINRNMVVVPLADLQELTFRPGVVTFLSVKLAHPGNPAEVERVTQAIEAIGGLSASRSENVMRNDSMLGLLRAVSRSMAWVALLMGVLMVLNTLLMAVLERTREIGILAAIGWSTERITGAIVIEGFILSAIGSAAGVVVGVARIALVERNSGNRTLRDGEPDCSSRHRDRLGSDRARRAWVVLSGLARHAAEPRHRAWPRLTPRLRRRGSLLLANGVAAASLLLLAFIPLTPLGSRWLLLALLLPLPWPSHWAM